MVDMSMIVHIISPTMCHGPQYRYSDNDISMAVRHMLGLGYLGRLSTFAHMCAHAGGKVCRLFPIIFDFFDFPDS